MIVYGIGEFYSWHNLFDDFLIMAKITGRLDNRHHLEKALRKMNPSEYLTIDHIRLWSGRSFDWIWIEIIVFLGFFITMLFYIVKSRLTSVIPVDCAFCSNSNFLNLNNMIIYHIDLDIK